MKNIKYQLVKEKELRVQPVDNSTLIALWMILVVSAQSTGGFSTEDTASQKLPVIVF